MSKEPINPEKRGCIQPPENVTHEYKRGFEARVWGRSFDSNPYFAHSYMNFNYAMASSHWDKGFVDAHNKLATINRGAKNG